jgi:hypothetical protein
MADNHATPVAIDTLGKLRAHGNNLWGNCLDCAALYRMDVPAERRMSGAFDIDLGELIIERGADAPLIRMAPVACPRCGGRRTECRIGAPAKGR